MIKKDEPGYTFVVTRSNKNCVSIRRIEISKRRLRTTISIAVITLGFITSSFYNLIRTADDSQSVQQQQQLQLEAENQRRKEELAELWQRVQTVEETSRQLAVPAVSAVGEGGPEEENETVSEPTSATLYAKIHALEEMLRDRANVPSIYPSIGKINNQFGWRNNPFGGGSLENHPGMDIDGEKGDQVVAPADGVVIKTGWQGGYGNLIEISHGNNLTTRYGHLSEIEVEVGQTVARGEQIGRVGSTGRSTGPHLHYEVRIDNKPVDPRGYLPEN